MRAINKVLGEGFEGARGGAEGLERGEGVGDELVGVGAGVFDAVDGGPGGLNAGGVLAGGLAEFFGGLGHVEDVVDDLEGEASFLAEGAKTRNPHLRIEMWGTRPCAEAVEASGDDGGSDEGAGLRAVDGLDEIGGGRDAFGFDVDDLAADHAGGEAGVDVAGAADAGADSDGDFAQDGDDGSGGRGELRDGLERERLEGVAGEDGDGFSEGNVAGRMAAAQIVVVERGQIVVNERVGVQHLQRAAEVGGTDGQLAVSGHHARGLHAEDGAKAFAAGEDAVAHGTVDGMGQRLGRGEKPFEGCVGERDAGGEQGAYRGIHQV